MADYYRLYGSLSDTSDDLYLITDIEGKIIDLNQKAMNTFGIIDKGFLHKFNLKSFLINSSDWDNYCMRMKPNKYISGLDMTFKTSEGRILTGIISSCLIEEKERLRVFIIHDISAYIESALDAVKLNLELLDKNHKLNNAYSTISHQEKLASLGELSAGVAHEINNPLAFVSSNLKSLVKYTDKIFEYDITINDEQKEEFLFIKDDLHSLFQETREGLERIESITKSLKRFSRMDEDSRTSLYNLNGAIEDTVLISKNQCPPHTEIILELGDIPDIECFANDINQVLLNIVINGLQAQSNMPRDFKGYLKIITKIKKAFIEIIFEDNGPGIPEEIEQKIYDPFFTTKEIGLGTGLGLGISFNIINVKHKGSLWLDNRKDPTRFIINLPLTMRGAENG